MSEFMWNGNYETLPRMFQVKQIFPRSETKPAEILRQLRGELEELPAGSRIGPGMRIAITAGSRGIANGAAITRCIVDFVKSRGGHPFVVPSMGSHGGATVEGQLEILEGYGITEKYMGCPIISSMEVKKIGVTEDGKDVWLDRHAAEADGIIVNCRIKPHTAFRGPYESGMMKMLAVGLGKQKGAEACHEAGVKNMARNIPMIGRAVLANAPVMFAVAALENAYDETEKIAVVDAAEIEVREPDLLKEAFAGMAKILVDSCDVLIVDQIGKNFSGDGMDPNITGTFCTPYAAGGIHAQRVCVLGLSEETHGNGVGIGNADVTTRRAFRQLDLAAMYPNAITPTVLDVVKIPLVAANDREAIEICLRTCHGIDRRNPRIIRIPNSLWLEHIMLSEAYYEEADRDLQMEIESEPRYLPFRQDGNLW